VDGSGYAIHNDWERWWRNSQASRLYLEWRSSLAWSIRKGKIKKRATFVVHKLVLSHNNSTIKFLRHGCFLHINNRFLSIITLVKVGEEKKYRTDDWQKKASARVYRQLYKTYNRGWIATTCYATVELSTGTPIASGSGIDRLVSFCWRRSTGFNLSGLSLSIIEDWSTRSLKKAAKRVLLSWYDRCNKCCRPNRSDR